MPIFRSKARQRVREEQELERVMDDAFGRPSERTIRGWSDRELHERLVGNDLHAIERSQAERELKRRENWEAPAGLAVRISVLALAVAAAALIKSFFFA